MSDVLDYQENGVYQFGILDGALGVIGGDRNGYRGLRFANNNISDLHQQWTIERDTNTDADYPYRLRLRATGFYLTAFCDYGFGNNCAVDNVNRARLTPWPSAAEVPDSGKWAVRQTDRNDNSYRWYSKANGTATWLDAQRPIDIWMNGNSSVGTGAWRLDLVGTSGELPAPPNNTSNTSNNTSFPAESGNNSGGLSGGAIGGIAAGVVVGVLALAAILVFWFVRRRKNARRGGGGGDNNTWAGSGFEKQSMIASELDPDHQTSEMDTKSSSMHKGDRLTNSYGYTGSQSESTRTSELPAHEFYQAPTTRPVYGQASPIELPTR